MNDPVEYEWRREGASPLYSEGWLRCSDVVLFLLVMSSVDVAGYSFLGRSVALYYGLF